MGIETLIVAPAKLWLANINTAQPAIDATPSGDWKEFGDSMWADGGLTLAASTTVLEERLDDSPHVVKAWNGEADLTLSGVVKNFSLETLSAFFNGNSVSDTGAKANAAGYRELDLELGIELKHYALLSRFYTPYNEGALTDAAMGAQLWLPLVYESGNLEAVLSASATAGSAFAFKALKHATAGVGKLRFKDANQSS